MHKLTLEMSLENTIIAIENRVSKQGTFNLLQDFKSGRNRFADNAQGL